MHITEASRKATSSSRNAPEVKMVLPGSSRAVSAPGITDEKLITHYIQGIQVELQTEFVKLNQLEKQLKKNGHKATAKSVSNVMANIQQSMKSLDAGIKDIGK